MAVPHYAYLKMKMLGTKSIITIAGDYKKLAACAAASSRLAESLVIATEKKFLDRVGKPLWEKHFHNEANGQKPGYLFSYDSSLLLRQSAERLLDWFRVRSDV